MAVPRIGRRPEEDVVVDVKPQEVAEVHKPTLDEAAEALIQMLPPDTVLFIREASESFRAPMWQMLCGYAMNCADRMQLYTPHLLSAWAFGGGATRERKCESCGQAFDSAFPEAMFCCSNCFFHKVNELGHTEDCPAKTKV